MRIAMSTMRYGGSVVGAVGLLAAALVGCSSDGGSDAAGLDAVPPTPSNHSTPAAGASSGTTTDAVDDGVSSLSDSFDDDRNGWALPPSPAGRTTVGGGDFVWESKQPNLRPHVIAETLGEAYDQGRLAMTDVVVRASVTVERGAPAVGVFCREVPDSDADYQWYEFVARDGYAAIRLADASGNLDVLVETHDVEVALGSPVALEASCTDAADGTASLAFSLDGRPVLEADAEDPLGNGVAGLQAYDTADESVDRFLVSWHDFAVEPA